MTRLALVFTAHAPWRLRRYNYFDVGRNHDYFDREILRRRIAGLDAASLEPAAAILEGALDRDLRFAFGLSLSGPLLDQLALWAPGRLEALRRLVETGRVEALAQTSHRSLAWSTSAAELDVQIRAHRERLKGDLGRRPRVFGGEGVEGSASLAESREARTFLGRVEAEAARLLEPADVGAGPAAWLSEAADDILWLRVDLAMHRSSRSILPLGDLERWLARVAARPGIRFVTPSEALETAGAEASPAHPAAEASPPANELQRDARASLAGLEPLVHAQAGGPSESDASEDWRRLTGSDHFSAMSLAATSGGTPPDASPYETYMAFRHAVSDLERRLGAGYRRAPALRLPA